MSGGFGSRLGSLGWVAGVAAALMAGSSGVAAAKEDLGGCTYYAPGEKGWPTKCIGWKAPDGKNLSGYDFSGADLKLATFNGANLRGTTFTKADLRGVVSRPLAATDLSSNMDAATRMDGALVDKDTVFFGLVEDQQVAAVSHVNNTHYFPPRRRRSRTSGSIPATSYPPRSDYRRVRR